MSPPELKNSAQAPSSRAPHLFTTGRGFELRPARVPGLAKVSELLLKEFREDIALGGGRPGGLAEGGQGKGGFLSVSGNGEGRQGNIHTGAWSGLGGRGGAWGGHRHTGGEGGGAGRSAGGR